LEDQPRATYTVGDALDDWLANGLSGRSDRTKELYRDTIKAVRERLGEVKLRELSAGDIQETLAALAARLSTRSLQITRLCLERAIRHAEVRDLVGQNVAALIKAPAGRAGRPSKSLTLQQAQDLLRVAADSRLYAYVVLSVTTGLRTGELRALRWNEVDLEAGSVAVYRAVRATADTKTPKSRRVLSLPRLAIQALREHLGRQAADRLLAGVLWQDHGRVFVTAIGTPLDRHNVLREFRKLTEAAGLGTEWVPREMRHTFVSLLSSNGTALEDIADLVGHRGTGHDRDGLPEGDRARTAPWRRGHGPTLQLTTRRATVPTWLEAIRRTGWPYVRFKKRYLLHFLQSVAYSASHGSKRHLRGHRRAAHTDPRATGPGHRP